MATNPTDLSANDILNVFRDYERRISALERGMSLPFSMIAGVATLVGGTVTISTPAIASNTRIFLTGQVDGGTPGFLRVSSRVAGRSFTISSSNGADTGQVGYLLIQPKR